MMIGQMTRQVSSKAMSPSTFMMKITNLSKSWVDRNQESRDNFTGAPAYLYTLRRKMALLSKREVKEKVTVPVITTLLQVE